ncbi:MAG TPA: apolipoprotein N-acyltransferase, partial [Porticoccaceae bacterium]|nr:apolipoprotein N-acyltransferase [Porticoccaceae bacterium]
MGLGLVFALPMQLLGLARTQAGLLGTFYFAAVWVLGEWFRGWFLTGFPWLYLGYGMIDTWLAGWLPIFGALGVSLVTALSAALCSQIPGTLRASETKVLVYASAKLMLIAALWSGGYLLQTLRWTTEADSTIQVS